MCAVDVGGSRGQRCGRAEAGAQGWRQGAGANARLLPAAVEQRLQLDALAHPERADALGPVDLVRRDRDHVRVRNGDSTETLDRVAEAERSHFPRAGEQLGDRLDDPNLVVDEHRPYDPGALVDRCAGLIDVHQPVAADRKDRDLPTLTPQPLDGVQHRGMLSRDGDDLAPARAHALEREVDRLGRAAGEDQPPAFEPKRLHDLPARDLDRRRGLAAKPVRGMGVREARRQPGQHRAYRLHRKRSRRLIVEVDGRAHAARLRASAAIRFQTSRKR